MGAGAPSASASSSGSMEPAYRGEKQSGSKGRQGALTHPWRTHHRHDPTPPLGLARKFQKPIGAERRRTAGLPETARGAHPNKVIFLVLKAQPRAHLCLHGAHADGEGPTPVAVVGRAPLQVLAPAKHDQNNERQTTSPPHPPPGIHGRWWRTLAPSGVPLLPEVSRCIVPRDGDGGSPVRVRHCRATVTLCPWQREVRIPAPSAPGPHPQGPARAARPLAEGGKRPGARPRAVPRPLRVPPCQPRWQGGPL